MTHIHKRQDGFSIVELMVSILIGLIILAGVIQVVISSKNSFMGQEEMSFIQENARYAVDVIGRDIQNAGHWGCAGPGAKVAMVGGVSVAAAPFMAFGAVFGYDGAANAFPDVIDEKVREADDGDGNAIEPDAILLRGLQGETYSVASHVNGILTLSEDAPSSLSSGKYVGVVDGDCQRFGVFRVGNTEGAELRYSTAGNFVMSIKPPIDRSILCGGLNEAEVNGETTVTASCTDAGFNQLYDNTATVMQYQAKAFYIGNSSAIDGLPALKRAVLRNGTVVEEEIALGVENMQVLYGVSEGNALEYKTATEVTNDGNWGEVMSVKVDLLFSSQTPVLPANQEQPNLLGNTYEDRLARQVVSSTFRLRNRM